MKRVAIIGAGPAGLMAAQAALEHGAHVDVFDAMPSPARKFLMAGKSGLNITHSEDPARFVSRYEDGRDRLAPMVGAFDARAITAWMDGLGVASFTGSSGRVFPVGMKASPLLRSWLADLRARGMVLYTHHRWTGWTGDGTLSFETRSGMSVIAADAVILALGGASWPRLGSDGGWVDILTAQGIVTEPLQPSNCGFSLDWSAHFISRHEGDPVKNVRLSAGGRSARGDFVITRAGLEGGVVYAVSAGLSRRIAHDGSARLVVDLLPDTGMEGLRARLARSPLGISVSNRLRRIPGLDPVKIALIHEVMKGCARPDPASLAERIKALPLTLTGSDSLARAISTAGGVSWSELDETLMLNALPGMYCAGEMIAWDAPTGGYLLTACLATGRWAGRHAAGGDGPAFRPGQWNGHAHPHRHGGS